MRFSTLTSLALATAVSSATLLKSSETDGDYWIGFTSIGDAGNGLSMVFVDSQSSADAVTIKDDTTLDLANVGTFGIYDEPGYGPGNLTTFVIDYEHPDLKPPPAPGFSWASNGSLLWSEEKFHGWVHCSGGDFSGQDYTSFYWSLVPITTLPDGCKQVDLVKDEQ